MLIGHLSEGGVRCRTFVHEAAKADGGVQPRAPLHATPTVRDDIRAALTYDERCLAWRQPVCQLFEAAPASRRPRQHVAQIAPLVRPGATGEHHKVGGVAYVGRDGGDGLALQLGVPLRHGAVAVVTRATRLEHDQHHHIGSAAFEVR